MFWAREGRYSNAVQSLTSTGVADKNDDSAFQELLHRHPVSDQPSCSAPKTASLVVDESAVLACLKGFPRGTSPGASGLRAQHLLDAVSGHTAPSAELCLNTLTRFMNFLLSGKAPPVLAPWLCGAPLTALLKKNGGVRPIAVGEILRRLASRLCCQFARPYLSDFFLPYGQVGVGIPGGLEAAIHAVRHSLAELGNDESLALLKIDMKNAFNECNRSAFLDGVCKEFPEISPWVYWCYSQPAELRFGHKRILASTGVQQGDPLGPLLFSLVLVQFVRSISFTEQCLLNLWYLDDGTFIAPRPCLHKLLTHFTESGPKFGLHINLSKCELYWPSGDHSFPNFNPAIKRINPEISGLELLGSPIWGPPQFYESFLSVQFDKIVAIQDKLVDLEDPQVELHLLRSCLSICKVTHLLRCVPSSFLSSFLSRFDIRLRECLNRILCCGFSDSSWLQATLPFRLGGLGLRESGHSAAPAFVGSCNSVRILVSRLVDSFDVFMPFPGEDSALTFLKDRSVSVLHNSTQVDLQAVLDDALFKQLLSSSSIRDQARLRALSHSSGVSSSWLKALPQQALGLAFSPHDFTIALRLWLGIPLCPSLPLCSCLSVIDQFGDHLLGCSHGPLRIQRHNALVSIVHHALLQDHPGVLREQGISSDHSRPGDIYHPDFNFGRPAYFDLSVRSTTQSAVISSASSQAGVAAAAGEVAKDNHYQDIVSDDGGEFIPLVCETFGVWTPYALSILNSIADRTTVRNGLSRKLARRQLLQQLSVTLWRYNAMMVLRHFSLTVEDNFLD